LARIVNTQTIQFWVAEYPHQSQERNIQGEEVCVGVAPASHAVFGPFFVVKIVNSYRCFAMVRNSFMPQLSAIVMPIHTKRFMQDGARTRTAIVVLDFVYEAGVDGSNVSPFTTLPRLWTHLATS
jgi:hypothetical protein